MPGPVRRAAPRRDHSRSTHTEHPFPGPLSLDRLGAARGTCAAKVAPFVGIIGYGFRIVSEVRFLATPLISLSLSH